MTCLAASITYVVAATPASAATTAISGGGGNSRLLIDYPEPQRGQILDYLFTPNSGAAVQLLKLEIGGDANSTDGAEPSHQHVRGDVNCNVGFEFWLGEQAVARNPNIRLVALPWAAPGWIGNGNFWTADMIDYDVSWLNCAKGHGLTINYLGGWNERGHDSGRHGQRAVDEPAVGVRPRRAALEDPGEGPPGPERAVEHRPGELGRGQR